MAHCKDCGFENLIGTLFCTECGESLLENGGGLAVSDDVSIVRTPQLIGQSVSDLLGKKNLIIMIPTSGRYLSFSVTQEIRIGRSDVDSADPPELNLEYDGGLSQGVSRRHALIKLDDKNENLVPIDLDSTNGTQLNNFPLPPELPYPVKSGDEVQFGNLLVHLFIK